jgi:hypothetical protein
MLSGGFLSGFERRRIGRAWWTVLAATASSPIFSHAFGGATVLISIVLVFRATAVGFLTTT